MSSSWSSSLPLLGKDALDAGIKAGNINIATKGNVEVLDLNEESKLSQAQHQETMRRFEMQKRAKAIMVPTAVEDVKKMLRELGHPVTLFGENPMDRRDRLREAIAAMELNDDQADHMQTSINQRGMMTTMLATGSSTISTSLDKVVDKNKMQTEVYYTHASESLVEARKNIASYSFAKSQERLSNTKRARDSEDLQSLEDKHALDLYSNSCKLELSASIVGDERPLSCVRTNQIGSISASGSFNPLVKLWDNKTLNSAGVLRGHEERITSLAWGSTGNNSENLLATSAADSTCKLWNIAGYDKSSGDLTACRTLSGHTGVVADCDIHPSGNYIGTASHDYTWRLWDYETNSNLQLQDGHINEVSVINFHKDGSLVLTADHAGVVLCWDIRSGQSVLSLQGHMNKVVTGMFSSTGFQAATCGIDNQVRIWDLRSKKCSYILPAHSDVITDLSFSKSGELIATSSFDGTLKVWSMRDYRLLNTLCGHTGKVMSCDFSPDEKHLISAGFDRTIKYWAHKDEL